MQNAIVSLSETIESLSVQAVASDERKLLKKKCSMFFQNLPAS